MITGLAGLRVSLAGVGAVGAEGVAGFAVWLEDFGLVLLSVDREPLEGDAKLTIANEALQAHRKTTVKLRRLIKPDFFEEEFFCMDLLTELSVGGDNALPLMDDLASVFLGV